MNGLLFIFQASWSQIFIVCIFIRFSICYSWFTFSCSVLLFHSCIMYSRLSSTARMCVWMDNYLYFRYRDREYLLHAYSRCRMVTDYSEIVKNDYKMLVWRKNKTMFNGFNGISCLCWTCWNNHEAYQKQSSKNFNIVHFDIP
jgi:hypothetical protein